MIIHFQIQVDISWQIWLDTDSISLHSRFTIKLKENLKL